VGLERRPTVSREPAVQQLDILFSCAARSLLAHAFLANGDVKGCRRLATEALDIAPAFPAVHAIAPAAIREARDRIMTICQALPDEELRQCYVTQVSVNARTLRLADEMLS